MASDAFEALFVPFTIGPLRLPNRVVMAPMGTGLDEDGRMSDANVEYYRRRAAGGTGTITVEATLVDPRTEGPEPRLHDRAHLSGMARVVDAVRAEGAIVGIQLLHPGRQAQSGALLAPSAIPLNHRAPAPQALTPDGIAEIVALFVRSAGLARDAGFDFVEIHGAHGYLLSDFLSPVANQRDDAYGGDPQRRTRFGRDVARAILDAYPDLPVFYRLSGRDGVSGGVDIVSSMLMSQVLEAEGVSCISVSGGSWLALDVMLAPMHEPRGHLVELAGQIRDAISIPVTAVGRLDDPALAARVLADGRADLVAIGRGLIADPDWCHHVRAGTLDRLRPCIACNACVELVGPGGEIRCAVNAEIGREHRWAPAPAAPPRRVAVLGSGPAGLEAARVARLRGHDVTVWERDAELGGKLPLAAAAPSKTRVLAFRDYQVEHLRALGVRFETGRETSPEAVLRDGFDRAIVATGATPLVPPIPGIAGAGVHDALAILRGDVTVAPGTSVAVIGGSATGCETAELLAEQGAIVTIIEQLPYAGKGIETVTRRHMLGALRAAGVTILTGSLVTAIAPGCLRYTRDGEPAEFDVDLVALAVGWRPLDPRPCDDAVLVAGDAHRPGDFVAAINSGADAGLAV